MTWETLEKSFDLYVKVIGPATLGKNAKGVYSLFIKKAHAHNFETNDIQIMDNKIRSLLRQKRSDLVHESKKLLTDMKLLDEFFKGEAHANKYIDS